jgi:hypothetical protein
VIYDDAVPRSQVVGTNPFNGGYLLDNLAWGASDGQLYGSLGAKSGTTLLNQFTVNAGGASFASKDGTFTGASGSIQFSKATGWIYNDNGEVVDPTTASTLKGLNAEALSM